MAGAGEDVAGFLVDVGGGEEFVDGGPGADVAPTDFGGDYENFGSSLVARGGLEDGVVDGDAFEFGIDFFKLGFVGTFADVGGESFEGGIRFGKEIFQVFEKGGDAPEKHAGVPMKIAGGNVLFGEFELGFFGEAANSVERKFVGREGFTHAFDVAEAGVGSRGRNAEDNDAAGIFRDLERGANDGAIFLRVFDEMVGGEDGHKGVALGGVADVNGSERDGDGGVAAEGFREDAFAGSGGDLLFDGDGLLEIGDGLDAVGRNEGAQAGDSLLEHGGGADDVEELLGSASAAARPEASATASSEDYGVRVERFFGRIIFHIELFSGLQEVVLASNRNCGRFLDPSLCRVKLQSF